MSALVRRRGRARAALAAVALLLLLVGSLAMAPNVAGATSTSTPLTGGITGPGTVGTALNATYVVKASGGPALAANGTCLGLLWKHRQDDINMSSVWACSRNDIASNIAVFIAAAGVWLTHAQWPDLVVGLALACLFLAASLGVLRSANAELRTHGLRPDANPAGD